MYLFAEQDVLKGIWWLTMTANFATFGNLATGHNDSYCLSDSAKRLICGFKNKLEIIIHIFMLQSPHIFV